ncbi:hypothetical protein EDD86DRAFT_267020 [Gorgonomyces haynaldii]|nr:hypothetical protein EDD86DRAFT_267020 [Gorgonomyces haynaldii]
MHTVCFTFDDYSHIQPLLDLVESFDEPVTIVLPKSVASKFQTSKSIHPVDYVPPDQPYINQKDHYLQYIMQALPVILEELKKSKITRFVLDVFLSCCVPVLRDLNVPIDIYCTTSALELAQRYHKQSYTLEPRPLGTLDADKALGILMDPEQLYASDLHFKGGNGQLGPTDEPIKELAKYWQPPIVTANGYNALKEARYTYINSVAQFYPPGMLDRLINDPEIKTQLRFIGPSYLIRPKIQPVSPVLQRFLETRNQILYVSFGTVRGPNEEEAVQLYNALVGSKIPFVWALKKQFHKFLPSQDLVIDDLKEMDDRIGCIASWVSQRDLLTYPSIRGFMSHCGWGSCLEAMANAVPVLCVPRFAEQQLNALFLVSKRMAHLVPESRKGGRIVPAQEYMDLIQKFINDPDLKHHARQIQSVISKR